MVFQVMLKAFLGCMIIKVDPIVKTIFQSI